MKTFGGHPVLEAIPPGMGTGYISRDYASHPMGVLKYAKEMPSIKSMAEAEILEAIAEKNAAKNWITNLCDRVGSKVKNQKNSSYCWGHAPCRGMECLYVFSGGVAHTLAAFDACAVIKGGSNQGGSGITWIEFVTERGVCVESLHAPMDFSSRRTAAQEANAQLHKIDAYDDIDPSDRLLIASYVVNDIPVTVGIPSMGHEMLITHLVADGRSIGFGCDNSWGTSDGVNGRRVCTARFDEAGAIRSVTPSRE